MQFATISDHPPLGVVAIVLTVLILRRSRKQRAKRVKQNDGAPRSPGLSMFIKQPLVSGQQYNNGPASDDGHGSIGRPELVYTTNPLVPVSKQTNALGPQKNQSSPASTPTGYDEPKSPNVSELYAAYKQPETTNRNESGSETGLTGLPSPRPGSSISEKPVNIDYGFIDGHNPMGRIVELAKEKQPIQAGVGKGPLAQSPFLGPGEI